MKIFTFGGSMRPFIGSRRILCVRCNGQSVKEFSKGDVVLYKKGDCYFVHRIVKKLDKGWIVEDDAGVVGRHFIERDEVIGKIELPWYISGKICFYVSMVLRFFFKIGRKFKRILCLIIKMRSR